MTGVLLWAQGSAVPSLTLFGFEMQNVLVNSVYLYKKKHMLKLWFKNEHSDITEGCGLKIVV